MMKDSFPCSYHHIVLCMSYDMLENKCHYSCPHICPNNYLHKTLRSVYYLKP